MTDLVPVETSNNKLEIAYLPEELFKFQKDLQKLCEKNLLENTDYGKFGRAKKPSLMKPGAEKLCLAFGLKPDYDTIESTIDHSIEMAWDKGYGKRGTSIGLYRYVVKCSLRNRRGDFMGSGAGICSSLENNYCDRPRDVENTIFKMAQKRALIAAVLNALGLSGMFTQDLEDLPKETYPEKTSQTPEAPRPESARFDPSLKEHQDKFIKAMEERGISDDRWDAIAKKIKGISLYRIKPKLDEILNASEKTTDDLEINYVDSIPQDH